VSAPSSGADAASSAVLRATALQYLADHNTVSLATMGGEGIWATTVFYANVDFALYFLSEPKTLHVRNVVEHPEIAATVNEDYKDWRQIKGLQMSATCAEVTGKRELARAFAAYLKKYPFVAQFVSPGQLLKGMQVAGKALDVRLFRVSPTRVLYIDNGRGFSNRQEIDLEAKQ
jgi:uncharacterized protein YhbP (UPF0306 family)